jgi:hypothetical protein
LNYDLFMEGGQGGLARGMGKGDGQGGWARGMGKGKGGGQGGRQAQIYYRGEMVSFSMCKHG